MIALISRWDEYIVIVVISENLLLISEYYSDLTKTFDQKQKQNKKSVWNFYH